MKQLHPDTNSLVYGALIAALYTVLTIAVAPIASGAIQCRVSEALCVLPWFFPSAVPGLFAGCLLSNILLGAPFLDLVFGSLASLLAAVCTRYFSELEFSRYLAPLPGVVFNMFIVGWVVNVLYSPELSYWLCALYVGIGQVGACYVIGLPLLFLLERLNIHQ